MLPNQPTKLSVAEGGVGVKHSLEAIKPKSLRIFYSIRGLSRPEFEPSSSIRIGRVVELGAG